MDECFALLRSQESRVERRGGDLNSGWSWAADWQEVENWFWWETAGDTGL